MLAKFTSYWLPLLMARVLLVVYQYYVYTIDCNYCSLFLDLLVL